MIARYSRKELTNIWSEENKYKIWLEVELSAAEAMEKYKLIPKGVAAIVKIWSEENKYKIWLDVEVAAAEAMEKYKIIPKGVSSIVKKKAKIKVKRIHQIEAKVKHDVIAF